MGASACKAIVSFKVVFLNLARVLPLFKPTYTFADAAAGKGLVSHAQQGAALEGLLDLLRTPGFVHDIYVNCDCRCAA